MVKIENFRRKIITFAVDNNSFNLFNQFTMKKLYLLACAALLAAGSAKADEKVYESIGTGQFQDGLIECITGESSEAWAIDVQQCTTDENLYRIENPYTVEACPFDWDELGLTMTLSRADDYWYINCTNVTAVSWTTFYPGLSVTETGYEIGVYYDNRYAAYECSTFADGIIKAVPYSLYTWWSNDDWGYFNTTVYLPGVEAETWNYVYDAKYTDGFWSLYTDTEAQSWNVAVYESSLTPGLIRVENPYMAESCPLDFGDAVVAASGDRFWEIDATDPDAVWQTSIYFSTGVEILPGYPVFFYQEAAATQEGKVITWAADALGAWYMYSTSSYDYLNLTVLELDATEGITSIAAESNEAPVYYNLQGIRMDDASAPGLYIKKQGNASSKILVK